MILCEHRHEYMQGLPELREIRLTSLPQAEVQLPVAAWPAAQRDLFSLHVSSLQVDRGGKTILEKINFFLGNGQVIALVGRNGAGKTTLLRALTGLQPYHGKVEILSEGKAEKPDFGLVFQNPDLQLFNATVSAEILYRINDPDMKLFAWLLDALDLRRYQAAPPLLLSEGEKRRLALATVLMRKPRHGILLDEPALGQDEEHKRVLMSLLRQAAAIGFLVIFSTHDIELAARADHLILLEPDGVIASGAPGQVLNNPSAWERVGLRIPEWALR